MSDVLQKWLKLKYPEQYKKEVYERTSQLIQDSLREAGVLDEAKQSGKSVDDVIEDRELKAWELWVKEYDTRLLDDLEISPKELLKLTKQRGSRSRGGKNTPPHLHKSRDLSLAAFLEVEREKGTYRDAVNRAVLAIEVDPQSASTPTVEKWLKELVYCPWCCSIPKPRPKKPSNKYK
jgi:hypothetical protein